MYSDKVSYSLLACTMPVAVLLVGDVYLITFIYPNQ